MRLGLSSAAMPRASFDDLVDACARRGLAALELRAGDWHGVDIVDADGAAAAAAEHARVSGVPISAYVADAGGSDLRLARVSGTLGVPLVVPNGADALERCIALMEVGANALPLLDGGESDAQLAAVDASGCEVALDLHAPSGELDRRLACVHERFGNRLRHVRLHGGGPESVMHEGRGIGALLASLALQGYDGELVVVPSSERFHVLWQTWLGKRGGWGCGSSRSEPAPLPGMDLIEARTK